MTPMGTIKLLYISSSSDFQPLIRKVYFFLQIVFYILKLIYFVVFPGCIFTDNSMIFHFREKNIEMKNVKEANKLKKRIYILKKHRMFK